MGGGGLTLGSQRGGEGPWRWRGHPLLPCWRPLPTCPSAYPPCPAGGGPLPQPLLLPSLSLRAEGLRAEARWLEWREPVGEPPRSCIFPDTSRGGCCCCCCWWTEGWVAQICSHHALLVEQ